MNVLKKVFVFLNFMITITPMLKQHFVPIGEKNFGIKLKKDLLKTSFKRETAPTMRGSDNESSSAKE